MIGVFSDTIIICTASAMIILLAGNHASHSSTEGIQLLQHAMVSLTGEWGASFVALIVILFAFSSIVANYIYAENNLFFCGYITQRPSGYYALRRLAWLSPVRLSVFR